MLIFGLLSGGCGPDRANALNASTAQPGDLLFSDDFSQVPSDWGTWDRNEGVIAYEKGGLRILVNQPNSDLWSVAGREFTDAVIQASVRRLAGPDDNDFGLICRYQDRRNFYMFLVTSDGYYGIAKMLDDAYSLIGIDQLQYSELIRRDAPEYQLQAACAGEDLKLYVDGELLLAVKDSDFREGDVGLLAGAYADPGVDILFDNVEVRQP